MPWLVRSAGVWDDLRDSLWLLPTVVVVAAAALASVLRTRRSNSQGVDVIVRSIRRQPTEQIEEAAGDRSRLPDQQPPVPEAQPAAVVARREGQLQPVDTPTLARSLRNAGHRVRIRPTVGDWVSPGTTLAS